MAPPGRRRANLSPATMLLGLFFLFSSTASAASAVLGVDLGTEHIKAALVKPGIPLEIVLTKDSKRKETSAIAFKPSKSGPLASGSFPERFYGGDAIALQARFPGDVYPNLKHLLGVSSDDGVVTVYKERYPALDITDTEGRKTISFSSSTFADDKDKVFSVEELLAMELKGVRENAKALAGKGFDIQDVVFTVPPFYNVAERRALQVAARLAGMKVLGMVTDGLAVGINYATSRTFPDVTKDGKPEINLVFDMGAGSTSATLLKFQSRTVKDVGKRNKTIQEVQIIGAGWDKTLGGDALNSAIVDDMVSSFVALPGAKSAAITAESVKSHGRTAAKLFKEAERIRQVLSANTETSAFLEGLYEDVDLRYKISRTRYEELVAAHATRIDGSIEQALTAAGLTWKDVDSIIVHGGATRTPFVQSRLEKLAGKVKIRANVNSDEAAVFGAAFKAAGLSPAFRVKEIRDGDVQGYDHGIKYTFNIKERDQKIFTPLTRLGAVKELPFEMMGEFEFTMYQAIPGPKAGDAIVKQPVLHFQSGNLTRVVSKMIDDDKCDRDTFKNFVQVRLSPVTGTPEVVSAWVTCEGETTDSKGGIVDGVKNLFGMGGKKDQEVLKEGESASESASKSSSSSSYSSSSAKAESTEAAKEGEKRKKTLRAAHTYDVTQLGYEKHPRKELKRMQDRLASFDASDKARRTREEVLNSLEAFTYRARDYLEDESFIGASIESVRTTLEEKLSAASDWIYSEGTEAGEKDLKAKLKELEDIVNPVLKRKNEALKRPDAIKEFKDTIAHLKEVIQLVDGQIKTQLHESSKSSEAVSKASAEAAASPSSSADPLDDLEADDSAKASASESVNAPEITEVPTIYDGGDLTKLEELVSSAEKWISENEAKQDKLKKTDDPAFTVKDINAEKKRIDDVIMEMMMKKMRHFKPPNQNKPKPKAKPKKKADKKAKKDGKKEAESPTEELREALKKAGVTGDDFKFKPPGDREVGDETGRKLKKLNLDKDSSEEDILRALDELTGEADKKKKEEEEKKHDEL